MGLARRKGHRAQSRDPESAGEVQPEDDPLAAGMLHRAGSRIRQGRGVVLARRDLKEEDDSSLNPPLNGSSAVKQGRMELSVCFLCRT